MQIHLLTLNIVVVKEFETEPKSYKESSHKNEPFSNSIRRYGGTGEAGASIQGFTKGNFLMILAIRRGNFLPSLKKSTFRHPCLYVLLT